MNSEIISAVFANTISLNKSDREKGKTNHFYFIT